LPLDIPTIAHPSFFDRLVLAALALLSIAMIASATPVWAQSASIPVHVISQDGQPLAGARIEGHRTTPDAGVACSTTTDALGRGTLEGCGNSAPMRVTATLQGFFVAGQDVGIGEQGAITITLIPAPSVQQSVTVQSNDSKNPLAEASSS
jgi:hypothetical protein